MTNLMNWFNEGAIALQVFRVIAAVGLLMALLQVFLRLLGVGDAEFDGDADSDGHPVSWTTLAGFSLGFGVTGALMLNAGFGVPAAGIAGAGVGLAIAAGFFFLMRGFSRLREDNTFKIANTVGKVGTAYIRIPAKASGGQIQVVAQSRMMTLAAMCDEEVASGEKVRVVEVIDHETVKVTRA